jgi:uncharacterized protein (DUF2235 family)
VKRIVICADGTWNTPEQSGPKGAPSATNVAKFCIAVLPEDARRCTQVVYYHKGVGVRGNVWQRLSGGAFGAGIDENIEDTYLFLVNNYQEGDALFLVGFSRGAYTVRSLAGLIRNSGVLRRQFLAKYVDAYELYRDRDPSTHPRSDQAVQFRRAYSWPDEEIRFIGVWDTVGTLGIPVPAFRFWNRERYEFHDVSLSTHVRFAYHALGLDEHRKAFSPTLWKKQNDAPEDQVLEQAWFPGSHGDVGGGYSQTGLSDGALVWMCDRAEHCGLALDRARIRAGDAIAPIHDSLNFFYRLLGRRTRMPGAMNSPGHEALHRSTAERREHEPGYDRAQLEPFVSQEPPPSILSP